MLKNLNLPALLAFAGTSYKKQLAYRIANISGLFTNLFFLFIRAGVFIAGFESRDVVAGLTLLDTLTYITLTQSFFTLMPHLGSMGLSMHIFSGQIAVELSRPMNFYHMYMGNRVGIFCYYFFFRFFPILVVGTLCGLMRMPADTLDLPLFFVSIILGFWIAVSMMFLIESTAFWLESDRGIKIFMYSFFGFFSGLLIPLNYFPDWAYAIAKALPIAYTYDTPTQIYLGKLSMNENLWNVGAQMSWCLILSFLCLIVLKRGEKKVVTHGG